VAESAHDTAPTIKSFSGTHGGSALHRHRRTHTRAHTHMHTHTHTRGHADLTKDRKRLPSAARAVHARSRRAAKDERLWVHRCMLTHIPIGIIVIQEDTHLDQKAQSAERT
jgi:hypothetical protein